MTFKIVCVLLAAVAACSAQYVPFTHLGPERYSPYSQSGINSYDIQSKLRPYFYRISSTDSEEVVTRAANDFMGKEYYGESATKSAPRYVISDEELSWTEASKSCKNKGMVLASPLTPNDKNVLVEFIRENDALPKDQYSGYWVGGQRIDDHYEWQSNRQMLDDGWLPGEPNGYAGEDCVELKKYLTLGWNNNYCHLEKRFICERIISDELMKNMNNGIAAQESDKENPRYYVQTEQREIPTVYLPKLKESYETTTTVAEDETESTKSLEELSIPSYIRSRPYIQTVYVDKQETSTTPSMEQTELPLELTRIFRNQQEMLDDQSSGDQIQTSPSLVTEENAPTGSFEKAISNLRLKDPLGQPDTLLPSEVEDFPYDDYYGDFVL